MSKEGHTEFRENSGTKNWGEFRGQLEFRGHNTGIGKLGGFLVGSGHGKIGGRVAGSEHGCDGPAQRQLRVFIPRRWPGT